MPAPHPDHPLFVLGGTWRGSGHGEYPTIVSFDYTEELVIAPVPGRPLAHWRSTTRDTATGEPRHAESGFLRAVTGGVELVVAHGFGVVETAAGALAGDHLTLDSLAVVGTVSAKPVDAVARRYEIDGDVLRYTIAMAAVGVPLTHHLRAELRRA
ncbi:MAG TPA: FABP family protein [Ilumatobacter sp.]|nr:FABP family protein [Ilumatobacter sp.]